MDENGRSVFISYAHADVERVQIIVNILLAACHKPWFDDHLVVGRTWQEQLKEKIEEKDVFLYALSPASIQSKWCRWEYAQAVKNAKPIVPVIIETIKFGTLPPDITPIASVQCADFTKGPTEIAAAKLVYGIATATLLPTSKTPILTLKDPPERPREPEKTDPKRAEELYQVALADVRHEKNEEAKGELEQCLALDPSHGEARGLLRDVQTVLGNLEFVQDVSRDDSPLSEPIEWVIIPAGTVRIRSDAPPYLPRLIDVPTFEISKYPITNQQYLDFLNASDGYVNIACWDYSKAAKAWRLEGERVARRSKFKGDDLPRTNVSWYDAVAFCQWFSRKVGQNITLPTYVQWQRAAQGNDDRVYPWGNRWEWQYCNSSVHKSAGITTPVTKYTQGASPYGVMDMSGNVWEWTHLVDESNRIILEGDGMRWLRGGSWKSREEAFLRIDKLTLQPTPRDSTDDIGFRVIRLN